MYCFLCVTSFGQNNSFQNHSHCVLSFFHSFSLLNAIPHMKIVQCVYPPVDRHVCCLQCMLLRIFSANFCIIIGNYFLE